ncbi:Uncharacterised protein [Bordetella pertussis]|nr:Uncharacterised protein [Bordetella pertussis]
MASARWLRVAMARPGPVAQITMAWAGLPRSLVNCGVMSVSAWPKVSVATTCTPYWAARRLSVSRPLVPNATSECSIATLVMWRACMSRSITVCTISSVSGAMKV